MKRIVIGILLSATLLTVAVFADSRGPVKGTSEERRIARISRTVSMLPQYRRRYRRRHYRRIYVRRRHYRRIYVVRRRHRRRYVIRRRY